MILRTSPATVTAYTEATRRPMTSRPKCSCHWQCASRILGGVAPSGGSIFRASGLGAATGNPEHASASDLAPGLRRCPGGVGPAGGCGR